MENKKLNKKNTLKHIKFLNDTKVNNKNISNNSCFKNSR